jgi:hypothetical protein
MTDTAAPDAAAADWTSGFTDDLKNFVTAKGARSPTDLAAAFAKADGDAAALISPPKDGVWDDAARAKLGIPAKAEEYKLTRPKLPDGMPYDEALEKAALPIAHKLGLTPQQLQGLVDFIADHRVAEATAAMQTMTARMDEAEQVLRKEWGGGYERQLSLAARAAKRFGGEDLIAALNETGFGNNPHLVRAFAKVASLIAEDTMKSDGTPTAPAGDAALAEIARIQGEALRDPKHPWINADHPEHNATLERMRALFTAAHPPKRDERER